MMSSTSTPTPNLKPSYRDKMGSIQPKFKNPATTTLLELVKARRTYYSLKPESPISDEAIERIIQE
jgi:hypothetical protein